MTSSSGLHCVIDDVISRNPVVSAIVTSTAKQSFLLWDKVYQKITDAEEEKWLLRATEAALHYFKADLGKNDALRYVAIHFLGWEIWASISRGPRIGHSSASSSFTLPSMTNLRT